MCSSICTCAHVKHRSEPALLFFARYSTVITNVYLFRYISIIMNMCSLICTCAHIKHRSEPALLFFAIDCNKSSLQYISITVIVCSSIKVCTPLGSLITCVGSSSLHDWYYMRYNIIAHSHVHIIKLQYWHCNICTHS